MSCHTFNIGGMSVQPAMKKFLNTNVVLLCLLIGWCTNVHAYCYDGGTQINFNKYWIAKQGYSDETYSGMPIHLSGPLVKQILDSNGVVIANVDENTYQKCMEEGTCLLLNKKLVNYVGADGVFAIVDIFKYPYGIGAWNNALRPFVSVSNGDLTPLSKLYIKELQGLKFPNGQVHNGCVQVDDAGSSTGCYIDLFIPSYAAFKELRSSLPMTVTAIPSSTCEILHYQYTS